MAGYWSYEGTDILSIAANEPTMNLEAFTMKTEASEFFRVVRHETGHTLGFPHEHMRSRAGEIDRRSEGDRVLRPYSGLDARRSAAAGAHADRGVALLATPKADPHSIMCYQIPGNLTKSGKPIIGGMDIDKSDYAFAASIYPKPKMARKTKPK